MKIGIYTNPYKDINGEVINAVRKAAKAIGVEYEDFVSQTRYDLVVSIGGDGTILRIAKDCAATGTPIMGINKGTVGFLTEIEPNEFETALNRFLHRDYFLERRALLDGKLGDNRYYALNDIVVRSNCGRMIKIEVRINNELIDKFTCDGYIAATPTGSTAYSLSAGGAVIGPNTPVIALTPVNPHTLRTRPIIVGSGEDISVKCCGDMGATVYVDGNVECELKAGAEIKITGWDCSALFVRFKTQSFYSRLLHKLNTWSAPEE